MVARRSKRFYQRVLLASGLSLAVGCLTPHATAKQHGVQTPRGRAIYDDGETFSEAYQQTTRRLIVEVVTGLAAEGNLGVLLGVINVPVRGLDVYSGYVTEWNPAITVPLLVRYGFNIEGYRPYLSMGYGYRILQRLGVRSHNVFFEAGYAWELNTTTRITLGAGARRPLHVIINHDSPLAEPDTDPEFLERETERSKTWVPTVALRFSRAAVTARENCESARPVLPAWRPVRAACRKWCPA